MEEKREVNRELYLLIVKRGDIIIGLEIYNKPKSAQRAMREKTYKYTFECGGEFDLEYRDFNAEIECDDVEYTLNIERCKFDELARLMLRATIHNQLSDEGDEEDE